MIRQPGLRQKSNGAWCVRWGGKDHYLSVDRAEAERLFFDPASEHRASLARWMEWKAAQRRSRATAPGRKTRPLVDVAEGMINAYYMAGRAAAAEYYRKHLIRFMNVHGEAELLMLTMPQPARGIYTAPVVPFLEAFKRDIANPRLGYAPKTINHDLTAVKRLINWAAEQGMCPPVVWKGVRLLPTRRGEPQDITSFRVLVALARARKHCPPLEPWLALNYLTAARPTDVVRLVGGIKGGMTIARGAPLAVLRPVHNVHGRVVHDRGLVELMVHKNDWRQGESQRRLIVLTDEALQWLDRAEPVWSRLDSYSARCRAVCGLGPSSLRDSAASHLRARGVALEDVQLLLGHTPAGEWRSYARVPWCALRESASRISVRCEPVRARSQ